MPGGAELGPVDDHAGKLLVVAQHLRQGSPAGREQKLVDVQEGDPAGVAGMLAAAVLERGDDRPRATVVAQERTRPVVHDHDALLHVGGEHLGGGRPCCRCRRGRIARHPSGGGTRSTPAGRRHHPDRSCRRRGRLRCARGPSVPYSWNRSTSSPRRAGRRPRAPRRDPGLLGRRQFEVSGDGSCGPPTRRASRGRRVAIEAGGSATIVATGAARVSARDRVAVEARTACAYA